MKSLTENKKITELTSRADESCPVEKLVSLPPRVLIACEFSGIIREAFAAAGCDAWSCDLLETEIPGQHIKDDVLKHLNDGWDLMIGHPPCTFITTTGERWFKPEYKERFPDRERQREEAIEFFMKLWYANISKICIENPRGVMSTRFRKPDQYIHPFQFGEPYSKLSGLWLKNLTKLKPTEIINPEFIYTKKNKHSKLWYETLLLSPEERWKARSRSFKKVAAAMAGQWAPLLFEKKRSN